MKPHHVIGYVLLGLLALPIRPAAAQFPVTGNDPNIAGIAVFGTGEVRAKPNLMEMELRTNGSAELSGDAIVKYRDAKRRMSQAFTAMNLKNMEIVERGVSLSGGGNADDMQRQFRTGQPPANDKAQIQIGRTLKLTLGGIQDTPEEELLETLGKICDVAKDSGIALAMSPDAAQMAYRYGYGSSGGAAPTFVLDNITELREKAYKLAVDDARKRAERLAGLTGVKLGAVIGVTEVQVSGDETPSGQQVYYGYPMPPTSAEPGPRVTSATFQDIPVQVKLRVRFAIKE